MVQGKWGNYNLEEIQKPQQQSAIPRTLGPAFSTIANNAYYKNNRIPTQSFVGDKVVQAATNQQTKPLGPLSQFSNGMDATPENAQRAIELGLPGAVAANEAMNPEKPVYGETPGSAYIYGGRDFMAKGSGPATGGFARNEESRLKDVAAEEARVNNFWADAAKQRAMETSDRQNSMMTQLDSAIRSGNQEQAAMLTSAIKGVGAIQPINYGSTENQLAEARTRQAALPYIGPKAEAETGLQNAHAGYYQGKNATERGNAMYEGYVKTLLEKIKGSGTKALSATDWKALSDLQMTNPEMYAQAMADLKRQG